ncbi:MAG: outer membrane lipoprotein chaperone LolA [Gammaproteobacteria bacterium]|nr:outer membrane lipoprotein chaperone LolA [Gammaproteobacteria bacterium]
MRHIKLIFIITLFFCRAIFADNISSADQLAHLLDQFTTLQAQFTQTTTDPNQRVLQSSHGTLMLQRPGHFRWETVQPSHQIVITDDNTVWIYDVDLQQATKQSLKNMPINPATLLSGHVDSLLKQFTVHMVPHHGMLVFQLIPLKPNRTFLSVALAFSDEKLKSMQIENVMQQTTTFHFSNVVLNDPIHANLFRFTVPAGVDVLQ